MGAPTIRLRQEHRSLLSELRATVGPAGVDAARFDAFRHRLMRHLMIEERLLVPRLLAGSRFTAFRNEIHLDHAALTALCMPLPHLQWVEDLADQLAHHHRVEEAPGGFYALVDGLGIDDAALMRDLSSLPAVVLPPFSQGEVVRERLDQVLRLITGR